MLLARPRLRVQLTLLKKGHANYLSSNTILREGDMSQSTNSLKTATKRPPFNPEQTFRLTDPPNPNWRYGDSYLDSVGAEKWAKEGEEGWKSFDPSEMASK